VRHTRSRACKPCSWEIYRAKKLPGPGQYDVTKSSMNPQGGRISVAKPLSDVEIKMRVVRE
jgi:hypothetical protein